MVLAFAMGVAERHNHRSLFAELAHRAIYVVADHGDYGRALALADRTFALWAELKDRDRMGRTSIARASALLYQQRYPEAETAFRAALDRLRSSSRRWLAAAHQGLGVVYYEMGDLRRAESAVHAAAAFVPVGGAFGGRLAWLKARIAAARGDLHGSERRYRAALEALRQLPADALLVAAELVRVLIRQRNTVEACTVARSLTWLVTPLEDQRVLAAAHADLVRAGLKGRHQTLTLGTLDSIIRAIKRGRALPRSAHVVARGRRP